MKFFLFFIACFCFVAFSGAVSEDEAVFNFGKHICKVKIFRADSSFSSWVSLHDDENTATSEFKEMKKGMSGVSLFEITQNEKRFLVYEIDGKTFRFDPNRIFSESGIQKTVDHLNNNYPQKLIGNIQAFSDSLLRIILPADSTGYLVSAHNNSNNSFSVLSYKNSINAEEVYTNIEADIDDFFIVTRAHDFEYLKSLNYNVVLQSNEAEDDGSLSVYAQKNNIPYISIEVQHGKKNKQSEMMRVAYELSKKRYRIE